MSRWELLKKALSEGGESAVKAAKELLQEVPSPEAAQALKGAERETYLKALDEVQGSRASRVKDYGMGDINNRDQDWYHGSFDDIKEFDPQPTKGTTPYLGKGTYLSTSPSDASSYASMDNVDTQYKLEKIAERLRDRYDVAPGPAYKTAKNKISKGLDSGAVYPVRVKMTGDEAPKYLDKPRYMDFDEAREAVKNDDIALMHPGEKWPTMDNITRDDLHARVKDSSKIRSINAAFDTRFKNSKNILAGGAGAAILGAMSPEEAEAAPLDKARKLADLYAEFKGLAKIAHEAPEAKVDVERAKLIAKAFDELEHAPNNPEVKKAYDALIKETTEQYKILKQNGLKTTKITGENPYKSSEDMIKDIADNNHLHYYPTESGFGTTDAYNDHPLLQKVNIDGEEVPANDLFRIVHDYFGHAKEGSKFGPRGEENAWREHMKMFSPDAQKALTTETRGQNSWVNYGPHGAANRANPQATKYADQKAGLLPDWAYKTNAAVLGALGLGGLAGAGQESQAEIINEVRQDKNSSPMNFSPTPAYDKFTKARKELVNKSIDEYVNQIVPDGLHVDNSGLREQMKKDDGLTSLKGTANILTDPITYVDGPAGLVAPFVLPSGDEEEQN